MKTRALAVALSLLTPFSPNSLFAESPRIDRVPAETVRTYETGTFLESVLVRDDGGLLVADHTTRRIFAVTPAGQTDDFAHLPDGLAGLAQDLDGSILATSGYREDGGFVTTLSPNGLVEKVIPVPGSVFLNGAALLRPGVFLVADSALGKLYAVDVRRRAATVWLEHALLAPDPALPRYPGANGVKVQDGAAIVTNSGKGLLIRIPIEGEAAGAPSVIADDLVLDDIAIAADGVIYGDLRPQNWTV